MAKSASLRNAALGRAAVFLIFWLMLAGAAPADLWVGVIAAGLATWCSLTLLPPGNRRLLPAAVAGLALRFPRQSVLAGWDVARRAFDPDLPLRPGLVTFRSSLQPGAARDAFCTLMSLQPGTVPVGPDESGALLFHCVDLDQPVAAQLALEEARFLRAIGVPRGDA